MIDDEMVLWETNDRCKYKCYDLFLSRAVYKNGLWISAAYKPNKIGKILTLTRTSCNNYIIVERMKRSGTTSSLCAVSSETAALYSIDAHHKHISCLCQRCIIGSNHGSKLGSRGI
jgi:hypothetical protein